MLNKSQLFDMCALVQMDVSVLCLVVHYGAVGVAVLVQLTSAEGAFYCLDVFVNRVFFAGHVDVVYVLGRQKVLTCLELLVV